MRIRAKGDALSKSGNIYFLSFIIDKNILFSSIIFDKMGDLSFLDQPLNAVSHLFRIIYKKLSVIHFWKDLHVGIGA